MAEPSSETVTGVGEGGHSTADMLRAGKDEAVDQTKAMVRDLADSQRQRAADTIGGMAQALHRSAGDLETENQMMARYTHMAADQLEQMSNYLRQSNVGDLLTGAENFARRQPYWFIGSAVAAGFLVARFLKSSGGMEASGRLTAQGRAGSAYAPGSTAAPGYGSGTSTATPSYGATVTTGTITAGGTP
jgi:ElaB/YqjD/DUF883 family membrane-anchored ribosome-binding protein